MNQRGKNIGIEIYRIYFTSVIALHHFRMYSDAFPFGGGYMATDFFFILSGFLLYISNQKKNSDTWLYLKNRYLHLFCSLFFCNCCLLLFSRYTIAYKVSGGIWGVIRESLMLEVGKLDSSDRFNVPTWYLGVMLFVSAFVWLLLSKNSKTEERQWRVFVLTIVGLVVYGVIIFIKGYGNIYSNYSLISIVESYTRGFCGMICGVCLACIEQINIKTYQIFNNNVIRIGILGLILLCDTYLLLWRDGYNRWDFIVYLWIIINVLVITVCRIRLRVEWCNLMCYWGKIAYFVYIIHFPIARIVTSMRLFGEIDWKICSILFLIICWGAATVFERTYCLVSILSRKYFVNKLLTGVDDD